MNTPLKLLLGLILVAGLGVAAYSFAFSGIAPVIVDNQTGDLDPNTEDQNKPKELETQTPDPVANKSNGDGSSRTSIDDPNIFGAECEQGIRGRLVSPHGGPVEGAEVFLMPSMMGKDALRMFRQHQQGVMFPPVAKTSSAADGTFVLGLQHWRESDKYEVRILHPDFCDHRIPNVEPQPSDWWDCHDIKLKNGVTVFGRVTTETGLPVHNARITVVDGTGMLQIAPTPGREGGLGTLSDEGGNYEIRNIDPIGVFSMHAIAENFAKDEKNELQLADSTRHQFDFKLSPGLDIAGIIVDPKGQPVAGAAVTVSALSQKSRVMEKTSSDKRGYFIVSGIKAGPYAVMVEAAGFLKIDDKPIPAGKKDLSYTLENQGRVYITVLDKNGRPLPNFHCNLKAAFKDQKIYGNAVLSKPVRNAKNGTILLEGINPMTYVAEIFAAGHAKNFSERFTITESQNEGDYPRITVKLNIGGTIIGTITDHKGKPIPGVNIITRPSGMIDNPFLAIFSVPYTITKRSGKTDRDGRFKFALLNPGKYQLKMTSEAFCSAYIQDIIVEVDQVSEHHNIKMTRGCSVSGITKVNGKPTGQVKVNISSVTDKNNPTPFTAEAVSDNEGRFLINKRLTPGKYEVMAAEQVQANPLLMMVQFSKSKQEITIQAGADHRVLHINIAKLDEGR